jgi:hypothetical protein
VLGLVVEEPLLVVVLRRRRSVGGHGANIAGSEVVPILKLDGRSGRYDRGRDALVDDIGGAALSLDGPQAGLPLSLPLPDFEGVERAISRARRTD